MENKYTLSVLFVNYEDFWSKVVYYVLGKGYGHASIGVDQDEEVYYSFNFKGFRREKPRKHEPIVSKSICYKLSVTKEEYDKVVEMLQKANIVQFSKNVAHYLPNRLEAEVQKFRNLEQVIMNPFQRSYC